MAGGHDNPAGAPHAHHAGDVPSLLVKQDGTAELDFRTYSFRSTSCWTLTVVVHAGRDNLGDLSSRYLSRNLLTPGPTPPRCDR